MTAAPTDKFKKAGASTVTSLAAPGKAIGATSITVGSTTNYPLDTGVVVAIRVVDTAGALVAGTYTEWNAIVTSATSFTLDPIPVYGSDQVYAAGSSTQVYISVSSSAHNQLVDGLLVSHDQDGTLKAGAVDVAAVLTNDVVETAKIKDKAVTLPKINGGTTAGVLTTDASGNVAAISPVIGYAESFTPVASIFSTGTEVLNTGTITIPAGVTKVLIETDLSMLKNANGALTVQIKDNGTVVASRAISVVANSQYSLGVRKRIDVAPGSSHAFTTYVFPDADTGTVSGEIRTISVMVAG